MQSYSNSLFDPLQRDVNYEIDVIGNSVLWRFPLLT